MENRREKSSSSELFSFPSTPIQDEDSDFEFGSITPDSPSTFNNSPADHLFVNGRLLPHSFPIPHQPSSFYIVDIFRSTCRTSSVGSKESSMSSRSNSTNSRSSSSCGSSSSSARSSSSDIIAYPDRSRFSNLKKAQKSTVSAQVYGSTQRWQFIASVPVPAVLSRNNSKRKKVAEKIGGKTTETIRRKKRMTQKKTSTTTTAKKRKTKKKFWFGWRVFRWMILVCKECHAIEPSRKGEVLKKTKTTTAKMKMKIKSH